MFYFLQYLIRWQVALLTAPTISAIEPIILHVAVSRETTKLIPIGHLTHMIAESLVRKQRFVKLNDRPLQPRQGFPELFVVGSVVGGGPRRNSGDGRTSVTRITRIGRLIVDGSAQRRYRLERTCLNTIRVNMEQTLFVVKTNLRLYQQPGHGGAHTFGECSPTQLPHSSTHSNKHTALSTQTPKSSESNSIVVNYLCHIPHHPYPTTKAPRTGLPVPSHPYPSQVGGFMNPRNKAKRPNKSPPRS